VAELVGSTFNIFIQCTVSEFQINKFCQTASGIDMVFVMEYFNKVNKSLALDKAWMLACAQKSCYSAWHLY